MANPKRDRQRAARAAKAAEKSSAGSKSKASEADADDPTSKVEVVSEVPSRKARSNKDDAAAEARRQAVRDVRLRKQRNAAFRRFAIIAGAVIAAFVLIGFLLSGGDAEQPHQVQEDANYITFLPADYGTGECAISGPAPESFADAPQMCVEQGAPLQAVFETSRGTVVADLDTTRTVGTANNFVNLARSTYYDGLEVFRTDPLTASVYSGAATNSEDDPGPGYTIPDEATGFVYGPGLLVMSRTTEPDSAGSEYFFTVGDEASALDAQGNFVVFGQITEGLDVLEEILALHVPDAGNVTGGRPGETVTILSVTIVEAGS